METVGFIGLGNMGAGIAANILEAGHPMMIHDLRDDLVDEVAQRGAKVGTSPADCARQCEVVFTSLPGPPQVEAVVTGEDGVLAGIKPGSVYVDLSTNRPSLIRELESRFRAKGANVIDAPVSGGKRGATAGTLAIMAGCDREVFERVKPILDTFGDDVLYVGAIGAGCVAKLVHNMISQSVRQAVAEGMTLGVKAGVDAGLLWECIRRGAVGRMTVLHERLPRTVFRGEFDPPSFALSLAHKDLTLAVELAREFEVPMPVAGIVEEMSTEAMSRGWGDLDTNISFTVQEEAAGVQVRADVVVD